jgi:glycine cleavage system H lipoate-binding protein
MTCPFLREAAVKYCQTAAFRKLIPLAAAGRADEKCASEAHAACPVFRLQNQEAVSGACPYLRESLMQYCGAAPVARFVPYSESLLSRCGNDGFRYCELYLQMAHPEPAAALDISATSAIAAPDWLRYSANHMWLDATEDGACHVGIDAFLSRALGGIEAVSYLWERGRHRPAVVLTAGGIDVEVVFPNPLLLSDCNRYLRADPSKISSDPYTGGWLFEGTPVEGTLDHLMSGAEARAWMEEEQRRMNEFLQSWPAPEKAPAMCDGGVFAAGVLRQLDRSQALALVHEFFSPYASGKRDPQ